MDKFIGCVEHLDKNLEEYKYFYEQPLLSKEPSLDKAIAFVRSIVK
jgi:hypothetical protein